MDISVGDKLKYRTHVKNELWGPKNVSQFREYSKGPKKKEKIYICFQCIVVIFSYSKMALLTIFYALKDFNFG